MATRTHRSVGVDSEVNGPAGIDAGSLESAAQGRVELGRNFPATGFEVLQMKFPVGPGGDAEEIVEQAGHRAHPRELDAILDAGGTLGRRRFELSLAP